MQRTSIKSLAVCQTCGEILDAGMTAYVGRLGVRCITCWDGEWDKADANIRKAEVVGVVLPARGRREVRAILSAVTRRTSRVFSAR